MSDSVQIRDRQTDLIKIIEAADNVLNTTGWQTLKEMVFDREIEKLERVLLNEAKSDEPSLKTLYKTQGELNSIKRYDLKSYAEKCKRELQGIKDNQI